MGAVEWKDGARGATTSCSGEHQDDAWGSKGRRKWQLQDGDVKVIFVLKPCLCDDV